MASTSDQPTTVRALHTPAAQALAELTAIFDELQAVLRCCERLLTQLAEPAEPEGAPDDLVIEALWSTAVLSYTRCFTGDRPRTRLTEDDLAATELQGEIVEWHKVLQQLRTHYTDPAANLRERLTVGAVQDPHGQSAGIAITSTPQPRLDDRTVRQTGALAYQLSRIVDQRITEQQEQVRTAAGELSRTELDSLPLIEFTTPAPQD